MKKLPGFVLVLFCLGIGAEQIRAQTNDTGKAVIVYYSWSGNSRIIADVLKTITGVETFEVKPVTPYTSHYNEMLGTAKQEISAIDSEGNYPDVKISVVNFGDCDTVFVIYPLWWSRMAAQMQSFLHNYSAQLAGKTLALVCTSGSSGISGTVADAKRLCPRSRFAEPLHIPSSNVQNANNSLTSWLKTAGIFRITAGN